MTTPPRPITTTHDITMERDATGRGLILTCTCGWRVGTASVFAAEEVALHLAEAVEVARDVLQYLRAVALTPDGDFPGHQVTRLRDQVIHLTGGDQ